MLYEKAFAIERRLTALVGLIRSGRHSTPALARKLKVSVPTVSRDITALRQRGYDIRSMRISRGWGYELVSEPAEVIPQVRVSQA
jgi:biotin operon repressor